MAALFVISSVFFVGSFSAKNPVAGSMVIVSIIFFVCGLVAAL